MTDGDAGLAPVTVAIVNTSPDAVAMLREVLEHAGFRVVSCFTYDIRDGRVDFEAFVRRHTPRVICYDIAPPYRLNKRLYDRVRRLDAVQDCQFVVTTTNAKHVQALSGRDEQIYEVVDKAEDLMRIVQAIKDASRARPTR